jgi:hypothetical protein
MTLELSVPFTGAVYSRSFEGEVDVIDGSTLLVRGRMRDQVHDIEHTWMLKTPDYEVLEASARQGGEDTAPVCKYYRDIRGVRVGRGFSKRILEALRDAPGAHQHLLLAVEMARLGPQVYQFPPGFEERFERRPEVLSADALLQWEKDRTYMASLPDSCYTYRDANEALFETRPITVTFGAELTRPEPGTKRVFWRTKELSIQAAMGGYACESRMQDALHDIGVGFHLDPEGTVSGAYSSGARLPYRGLCEEPQRRVAGLNGVSLSAQFIGQLADHVGGSHGCTHLFDLSTDCLKLFRFEAPAG